MTDTPRPTPADLQTWRREALTEHRFNDVDSELDVMARRILALLDALTAAEQEADSDRERAVAHEMDANGLRDTVRHLKAALTAKDEALAAMQEKVHELTRPMADVEYHNRAPGGWMDEVKLLEAESARLTAQVEALQRETRRHCQQAIETPCPSCGSRSLFIATGGHLTCGYIPCKEPGLARHVKALKAAREAAEAQATRLTEKLEDISAAAAMQASWDALTAALWGPAPRHRATPPATETEGKPSVWWDAFPAHATAVPLTLASVPPSPRKARPHE